MSDLPTLQEQPPANTHTNRPFKEVMQTLPDGRQSIFQYWLDTNKPKSYAEFKDNMLDGTFLQYYDNGFVATQTRYAQNRRVGLHSEYRDNSQKVLDIHYPETNEPVLITRPFLRKVYYNNQGQIACDISYHENYRSTLNAYRAGP
jgi:antitoxin component YwqK of YwqJK toxin-antitoxin module